MLPNDYLKKGITGLARAIDHSWNQGHFGCAVIATYFLCKQNNLSDEAVKSLRDELDKMMASRSHLFELWNRVQPVHEDPMNPLFWSDDIDRMAKSGWGYAHFFKYRYHFYELLKLVPDSELKKICEERLKDYMMNDFRNLDRKPSEFFIPLK